MQRIVLAIVLIVGLWVGPAVAPAAAQGPAAPAANATVGTGTPASCTADTLNTALALVQTSGGGTLSFDCGAAPHTIVVSPTLLITTTVIIDGGSLGAITLSGGNLRRVITVNSGSWLSLLNLVLTAGVVSDGYGGCLYTASALTQLDNVIVHTCRTGLPLAEATTLTGGPGLGEGTTSIGGAIANIGGTLTLSGSQVLSSTADTGAGLFSSNQLQMYTTRVAGNHAQYNGGGLAVAGNGFITGSLIEHNTANTGGGLDTFQTTDLTLENSHFYSNTANVSGGGLYSDNLLTITGSVFDHNFAGTDGGGLYVYTGTTTITDTVFSSNYALNVGGGLFLHGGFFNLRRSLVDANISEGDGGGVGNDNTRATLTAVTISRNVADDDGGGYYDTGFGWSVLTNVTVSGNQAGSWGGGIKSVMPLTMTNVTVAFNAAQTSGGGFYRTNNIYPYTWVNVLLAGNTASGGTFNCTGALPNSDSNSLSSDPTCVGVSGVNAALPLGPLQVNGSLAGLPLPTHLSLPGSEALDGGSNLGCPATDQRGVARPIGAHCDVGAVENGGVLPWLWLPQMVR